MLAALEGLEEGCRQEGVSPVPTAIFAAGLAAARGSEEEQEEGLRRRGNVLTVAAKAAMAAPTEALSMRAGWARECLAAVFTRDASNERLVRAVISCSASLCASCALAGKFQISEGLFQSSLALAWDDRPAVRREARLSIARAIASSKGAPTGRKGAKRMGQAVARRSSLALRQSGASKSEKADAAKAGARACELLESALPVAESHSARTMATEAANALRLVGNREWASAVPPRAARALSAFAGSSQAETSEDSLRECLEGLLEALEAGHHGEETAEEALQAAAQVQVRMAETGTSNWEGKLAETARAAAEQMKRREEAVASAAASCLKALVRRCLTFERGAKGAEALVGVVEGLLGYRHAETWELSVGVAEALFERLGKGRASWASGCLASLNEMGGAKEAIGKAVECLGAEGVLGSLPIDPGEAMQLEGGEAGRIWLLDLVRRRARAERSDFFPEVLLPMADECLHHARESLRKGKPALASRGAAVEDAIWQTLPSLLRGGQGKVPDAFADRLAEELEGAPDPHLRRWGVRRAAQRASAQLALEGRAENLARASDVLLRSWLAGEEWVDEEAVAELAAAGSAGNARESLKRIAVAAGKATSKEDAARASTALVTLGTRLAASNQLDEKGRSLCLRAAVAGTEAGEGPLEKRSYGFLATALRADPGSFLLEPGMLARAARATPSKKSARARMAFIRSLLPLVATGSETMSELNGFTESLLAEAVLGCKDPNGRARRAAYGSLIALARVAGGERAFDMAMAGLAGASTRMVSASLRACGRLAHDRPGELAHKIAELLPAVKALLEAPSPEVARSAAGFVKVAAATAPTESVDADLEGLLASLLGQGKRAKVRAKSRGVMTALLSRLGEERVREALPAGHERLLTSVKKAGRRRERKRQKKKEDLSSLGSDSGGHTSFEREAALTGKSGSTRANTRATTATSKSKSTVGKSKRSMGVMSLPEGADLMDESRMRRLASSKGRWNDRGNAGGGDEEGDEEPALQEGPDGRLVLAEGGGAKRKRQKSEERPEEGSAKRRKAKANPGRSQERRGNKGKGVHEAARFKGKGKGDVHKGGMQPYAYWPLDRRLIARRPSKRKQASRDLASATAMRS